MALDSAQPQRLARGGLIDRTAPLSFSFDGRHYQAYCGDTLASALLANGRHLIGRSFKYHRPRGILSAGSDEPNALVTLRSGARSEPNTRATMIELYDGLVAHSQNRWPSLAFDVMAVNQWASPLLGAGFYYKTFMWPASFWEKVYEPLIRRAAGLGRAADAADPDTYEKAFAHCDVLVIGGGAAGLMAALAAGRTGARVLLADEDVLLGGRLLSDTHEIAGLDAHAWTTAARDELAGLANVRIMRRTTVFGVFDGGTYGAIERVNDHRAEPPPFEPRQRLWRIIAKRAVLATGAIERPLVFGGNDRPGIMLAGAVRTYLQRFAAIPGRRIVVFTSSDDGWRTAHAARIAGLRVEAVIDTRADVSPRLAAPLAGEGTRTFFAGSIVATDGGRRIAAVTVRNAAGDEAEIECDALAVSGGWSPTLHLTGHLGGKPRYNDAIAAFVPDALPPGMIVAGAANGVFPLGRCLATGVEAGRAAAQDCGFAPRAMTMPRTEDEPANVTAHWHVAGSRGKAFVDLQNDVTVSDLQLAVREGYRSPELAKRYTTLGMATDQGKGANVNGLGILAGLQGRSIDVIGSTVYRPPFTPVSFGALAGHHRGKDYRPTRLTPAHSAARDYGAVFVESGAWLRASWFARPGETDWLESVTREVRATRTHVGVCDVSTLGKIDIQGPDAAEFLDRVYCNTFSTLAVGKARYGLMLREDGLVMDDGTTARLGERHYLMTTTTANAVSVMQHLEFCHQCLWPTLDVQIASVSEQWAQFSAAGPKARDLLRRIVDADIDLSDAAFPFMAARDIRLAGGERARLFRISFSGERAYEIAVPARLGDATFRALLAEGQAFGVVPYGVEALAVMRIEKGHVGGNEINGTTTARDLGLGKMMATKKDYIGRVLAMRPAFLEPRRWDLVGLKPVDRSQRLGGGAHLIGGGKPATADHDEGYVTSVAYSPMLESWIGLGLLAAGRTRIGERVRAVDLLRGRECTVEVCHPIFYDPNGEKLHA
jgi:sarcosine oxidase subunit alpha